MDGELSLLRAKYDKLVKESKERENMNELTLSEKEEQIANLTAMLKEAQN